MNQPTAAEALKQVRSSIEFSPIYHLSVGETILRRQALDIIDAELKALEPPLELETEKFLKGSASIGYDIDGYYVRRYVPDKIQVSNEPIIYSPAEARDLAKILNYWAEEGKLPERVVVKEAK